MDVTYTTIAIRNPFGKKEAIKLQAKVDTGAALLVLPGNIAKHFGFKVIRRGTVKYANEKTADRNIVGTVEVTVCNRTGWFEAIVEPKKDYALLGAVVMESLDLVVEPRELKIYPNPRSPKIPMAEIE